VLATAASPEQAAALDLDGRRQAAHADRGIAASTAVLVAVAVVDTVREVDQAPSTSR
jgi:hypothetical protein